MHNSYYQLAKVGINTRIANQKVLVIIHTKDFSIMEPTINANYIGRECKAYLKILKGTTV